LTEIVARVYELNSMRQRRDELQGMDAQDRLQRVRGLAPCSACRSKTLVSAAMSNR
jgi:hypothetical protein